MRVTILANVPVWILPGLADLRHGNHYATWLESLIPELEAFPEIDVHWITMCKETSKSMSLQAHGQTFHILPRGSMALQMTTGYVGEITRIRRLISKLKPDLLHAWGSEDVYGLAGAWSGVNRRIFTLQGCLTEYLRLLGGSTLFRLQALYERPTIRRYSTATAESPSAAGLLQAINPKLEIELVDYGVNPDFSSAVWNPSQEPELLFVGSISNRKGIEDLVSIARLPELQHIRFKIAGDGPLQSALRSVSTPNIEWLGKCDRKKVIRHMESAWGLVIPTYSDTGPTVVKEARMIGLPVITTDSAGASHYIEQGKSGFVGKAGDLGFLRDAITQLTIGRSFALEMGVTDHEKHRILLHPRATAKRFAEIYKGSQA